MVNRYRTCGRIENGENRKSVERRTFNTKKTKEKKRKPRRKGKKTIFSTRRRYLEKIASNEQTPNKKSEKKIMCPFPFAFPFKKANCSNQFTPGTTTSKKKKKNLMFCHASSQNRGQCGGKQKGGKTKVGRIEESIAGDSVRKARRNLTFFPCLWAWSGFRSDEASSARLYRRWNRANSITHYIFFCRLGSLLWCRICTIVSRRCLWNHPGFPMAVSVCGFWRG
jgi:hypothetical protein